MMAMACKDGKGAIMDNGKYVRYTPEQVEALERLYHDCPKPSSLRRQQLIRECPILSNIEPKQIKVWFQNRRCREKQRKEASRLQTVNRKLSAMNKLLMEENNRLQKQVSHLVYENGYFRQHTQNTSLATKDTSCESVVTNGQHRLTAQHPPRDASPAGLLSIAEETLTEFLSKATGTAIEWVQMPGMKLYAPTTLATARDFLLLRYTSAWSVPEVLRPLYESPIVLAQKMTMMALRQLRQIALEVSQSGSPNWGRRPAALRALSQRLSRGFNEALNGFTDEGWSLMANDGVDDVTILVNSSPEKLMGFNPPFANGYQTVSNSVLCAKASMLLQNVPPALLLRFLREHRSEWADNSIDAYSAAAVKLGPCSLPGSRVGNFGGQLCNGMDENAVGMCAELIFAPIDASFADDAPLLASGFRIIPLDPIKEASSPNRTLDLASALEIGGSGTKISSDRNAASGTVRSVMTIAFEFAFESHMQESVASIARQYVRSIISSVQRVASALSPNMNPNLGLQAPLGTPEAHILARWICRSYSCYLGTELLKSEGEGSEYILKSLWHHSDAIIMGRPVSYERAVAWKVLNEEENAHCVCFTFINWSFV
ncbi:Homeodomain-containing protein [Cynara cardunculus var. scolymus]|uniref:Homeodomain-containing protein n=1 Tax=Cynara cardunculus var. scolymus TaxID=59895 RepID=A0A103XW58_CYNCS|nr:Homeodomain-containing protein [Cynara cardunculus var. scolymus]